jgi:hypothetical protein
VAIGNSMFLSSDRSHESRFGARREQAGAEREELFTSPWANACLTCSRGSTYTRIKATAAQANVPTRPKMTVSAFSPRC